eukprot:Lithocolla_globosa_v1_NODE_7471_length_942_cov_21.988726.p1 type:complete len:287 gc:universal NODE_7471_length_942_cov_21.988726:42-902(+)
MLILLVSLLVLSTSAQETCTVNGILGVCIDTSSCSGTSTPGYCSGPSNIQCCTDPSCSVPGVGNGTCRQTSACSGRSYAGYCQGPTDLQCCVGDGGDPGVCPPIITRAEWGARPPRNVAYMSDNVPYAFIHHSYGNPCYDRDSCTSQMRWMQNLHMDTNGWADIGYSFAIGGDGNIYEGRGFNVQGAHTSGYNSVGYGVCFIGTFCSVLPGSNMEDAYLQLVDECLVAERKVQANYRMYGHRQAVNTACPGNAFYAEIQTWPKWTPGSPSFVSNETEHQPHSADQC